MDLRELLRGVLIDTDRIAASRNLPRSAFTFGDVSMAVRLDGTPAMQRLTSMIAADGTPDARDPVLIDVIGGALPDYQPLLPPPDLRSRTVLRSNADIYYLWLDEAGGYLTAIDRRVRRGLVWFTAPERIASWHIARPFLHVIKALSMHAAWTPIHAAGLARDGKGILVVGQSGAGKTSIAMSCAVEGWNYLGDDAVIVRADPARMGALYRSARLRADTFAYYPEIMKASLGISDDAGEQKAEVDMALYRRPSAAEAEIRAIVVPQPTDWSRYRIAPISRSQTLHALMHATRQSMIGDDTAAFTKLAALVAAVPCYSVAACGDRATLSAALSELLDERVAP